MTKQPDLRAHRSGRPASNLVRHREYQEYRESNIHCVAEDGTADEGAGLASAGPDTPAEVAPAPSLPVGPEWVATPTGGKVLAGLRYAQLAGDIVVICGGAGLGKSKAIEHYSRISPNVFSVSLTPSHGGVLDALEEIAMALGLRNCIRQGAFLHRSICTRLRNTNALLVIDEAQQLGVQALDQVRGIHDGAKIGLALVGNERIYTQLSGTNRAAYLDRLYSRIGKRIHLRRSTDADADALAEGWGVRASDCRARLREIGRKPGALRVLGKVLRLATLYAEGEGRAAATLEDIEAAWADLGAFE